MPSTPTMSTEPMSIQNTWQMEAKEADGVTVANQLTLKQEDYSGLSEWTPCNHKCLCKWKRDMEEAVFE